MAAEHRAGPGGSWLARAESGHPAAFRRRRDSPDTWVSQLVPYLRGKGYQNVALELIEAQSEVKSRVFRFGPEYL